MASRELYSSIAPPKKKTTFGDYASDFLRFTGDNVLSLVGAGDVIQNDTYKTKLGSKAADIMNPLSTMAGKVGLSIATGGLGGAAVGPSVLAGGGLRTFEGNRHENGGIQLGQDEVEGGETMMPMDAQSDFIFSDRLSPIKSISPKGKITYSKKTFAQKSKEINKPLELRPNDPYAKKTADIKLKKLAQEQEILKSTTIKSPANHMAMGGRRYFGGGGREPITEIGINFNPTITDIEQNRALFDRILSGEGLNAEQLFDKIKTTPDIARKIVGKYAPLNSEENYKTNAYSKQLITALDQQEFGNVLGMYQDTVPEATFGMYNNDGISKMPTLGAQIDPSAGKFKTESLGLAQKPEPPQQPYKSNFLIPALGYAAQALTNIPGLLAKPETINSSRVKFKDINLAEQRNEARRSRNLGLATARGIGSTDAGQMMNYLSGTTAGLNSVYGNQFNQSLLQEEQANVETNMREQLANSEIERYDAQINAQEKDAARALRMNALQNLGTIAAGAGKDYMAMQESDNMINILRGSNPDFTYDVVNGKLVPVRIKAYGGKRRKV